MKRVRHVALGIAVLLSAALTMSAQEIFVPTPRGTGDTLDNSQPAGGEGGSSPAVVKTLQGDVLQGAVLGVDAEGTMRLTGRAFMGEVKVAAVSLDSMVMPCTATERGQDLVRLSNGDSVRGELAALTAEGAVLNTDIAGRLKIPRKIIASITLGRGSDILLESRFASGNTEPWAVKQGTWSVTDGKLTCINNGNYANVAARLDQDEAITFVAKMKATAGNMQNWMMLFVDEPNGSFGRNSLYIGVAGSELYLGYSQNGSTNHYTNRSFGRNIQEATARFGYDPKTGKVRVWIDSTDYGEFTPPIKPSTGKYVMYSSYYSSQTSELTVLRGIVPPEDASGEAEDAKDVVEFGNKDRVSADDITMVDGQFTVKTSFGELKPQAGKVTSIVFRKKEREEPRRMKNDVEVQTAAGRMTVDLKELNATHLVGSSTCYGDVKIARNAIRGIRFNIYR